MRANELIEFSIKSHENDARKSLSKRLNKSSAKLLFRRLESASVEKDIEDAWKSIFSDFYIKNNKDETEDYKISSPFNTDGFISMDSSSLIFALRILMEFKQRTDLTKSYDRCRITAQIIHYMKNFEQSGYELPTVLVGADESQAFILLATNFYKYLDRDYNWDCSPSSAYIEDPDLMNDLGLDANMSVFPFEIMIGNPEQRYNSLLSMFESIQSIVQSGYHTVSKVKVTPANIVSMFDEFSNIAYRQIDEVSPNESVNIFMQLLTASNSEKYYFIPANHNLFHLPGDKTIDMHGNNVEAFFNHYDRNLSPKEIDHLKSIADRLIEANERRFKGDYWTPSIWTHRADEMLQESLGIDYKDKYLVWDCAAGVRNLTRDFHYNNLYISTYYHSEIMLGEGYNPEAKAAFQYDFLNDDVDLNPTDNPNPNDWKMPNSLFEQLIDAGKNDKPILFYTNPPYGTANNKNYGTSKAGIARNKINNLMKRKKDGYGSASQQLYAQFFVRVMKIINDFNLTNVTIGFFTNSRFFAGGKYWQKFNNHLFSHFKFVNGNYLSAGEFSDTSDMWPITFSVYNIKKDDTPIQSKFDFKIERSVIDNSNKLQVEHLGKHTTRLVYDDKSLREWANIKSKDYMATNKYPQLGSALGVSKSKTHYGKLLNGSLGYMVANSDNVGKGQSMGAVWIVTSSASSGHGFNVMNSNFNRAIVHFAARRAVTETWVNHIDNYVYPNTNDSKYNDFVNDSLIFALFDNASYQAAYRTNDWTNINIPGKWANQWFWLSKQHMLDLADKYHFNDLYQDARNDSERYVFNEIVNRNLSKEAQEVLESATDVLDDTFKYRQALNNDFPDLFLNAWDAGWFQAKQINHKYPVNSYTDFTNKFKVLKNKLNDGIYELGMLTR